jgi:DNA-binding NarL/FixJ family response regulator
MEAVRTLQSSPLGEFLRRRLEEILARWEAGEGPAASAAGKAALWRFLAAVDELGAAVEGLLEPAGALSERAPGCRVLLLGEAPPLAADLAKLLGSSGEAVARAATADEAVQSAVESPPDVVVGWGAASYPAVRAIRECLPGVPVIVANADRADAAGLAEAYATDPVVLFGPESGPAEIAMAARALAEMRGPRDVRVPSGEGQEGPSEITEDPRSYPHLAGLLPRALERAIDFDVGAGVVSRPGTAPLVDVYPRSDCSEETLGRVREHALALFRLVAGGAARVEDAAVAAPPSPLRSALHVPLATDNRIVGLTYLAAFRPDAFSRQDEEVLAALATRASTGYRRLESSLSQLRVTPRQSQVLALVAAGLSDKEVASRLGLSHRTVRTHLDRLLREHGFRSRTEAVAAWLRAQQS